MDRILNIVTPASSRNLTTTVAVKAELGITDSASDAIIDRFVAAASRAAAKQCNGELVLESVSEQFRAYPFVDAASITNVSEFIYLRRTPLVTVGAVIEDGATLAAGVDFETDMARGRMTRLSSDIAVAWSFQKLTVAYTGGYVLGTTLEPDIERAVIEIVRDMWFSSQSGTGQDIRGEELAGVGKIEYYASSAKGTSSLPQLAIDLLAPYQRPAF